MLNVKAYKEENEDEIRCEFITHVKKDEFDGILALMKAFGATVSIVGVDDFKPVSGDIINNPEKTISEAVEMPDISTEIENAINSSENYVEPATDTEVTETVEVPTEAIETPVETAIPETTETSEVAENPTETAEVPKEDVETSVTAEIPAEAKLPFNEDVMNPPEPTESGIPTESEPETPDTPEMPEPVEAAELKHVTYSYVPQNAKVKGKSDLEKYEAEFQANLATLGIVYQKNSRNRYEFDATESQIAALDACKYTRF